jgi:hypothetical protein
MKRGKRTFKIVSGSTIHKNCSFHAHGDVGANKCNRSAIHTMETVVCSQTARAIVIIPKEVYFTTLATHKLSI